MVRVNLIRPSHLADQHLVAEYAEILTIFRYAKKHSGTINIPQTYCLGTGHIRFFKNKLGYLKKRHALLRAEMKRRGFTPWLIPSLRGIPKNLIQNWRPRPDDRTLIQRRLVWKLKKKSGFYRYYRKHRSLVFFVRLTKTG